MDTERYNQILKLPSEYSNNTIEAFIPTPKKVDYDRGYIERYFVQKSNDTSAHIFEVSSDNINQFLSNPFYSTIKLDWRLIGDPIDIKNSNSTSIRIASETIPKIQLYLPNLLQFHQK